MNPNTTMIEERLYKENLELHEKNEKFMEIFKIMANKIRNLKVSTTLSNFFSDKMNPLKTHSNL